MALILKKLQETLVGVLTQSFPQLSIVPCGVHSLEKLQAQRSKKLRPVQVHVAYPMPLQVAEDITALYWQKIALQLTVMTKLTTSDDNSIYEYAEQISYALSHRAIATHDCEVYFELNTLNPWKELPFNSPWMSLQINFTSSQCNLHLS